MSKQLKVYYVNPNNMGDLLNELIIPRITSRPIKQCLNPITCDILGIGSSGGTIWTNCNDKPNFSRKTKDCVKMLGGAIYRGPCAVWGAGFFRDLSKYHIKLARKNVSFISVRGELSRRIIENALGQSIDPVLCDGGILASSLIDTTITKQYKVGFIPHFKEHQIAKDMGLVDMIDNIEGATIIDLREDPMGVIRKIASCEYVVSSSLHGCIVADSFHIPNMRVRISDIPGTGFKFDDYYSGYGLECPEVMIGSVSDFPSEEQVISAYRIDPDIVEQKKKDMSDCLNRFILENGL